MGLFQRLSSKVRNRKSLLDGTTPKPPSDSSDASDSPDTMPPPPPTTTVVPDTQTILLLYAPKQPYQVVEDYAVPKLHSDDEVLVRTRTIGLNPIDWKAP